MSTDVTIKELLEAGSHFGHQVSRWNPKMRPYIFSAKSGIHILDLEQTHVLLSKACKFITDTLSLGGNLLFVGTKKQAKVTIETEAKRSGQFFVSNRWLGGLLTNFKTIKASVERLLSLEQLTQSEEFQKYTKKERLDITRQIEKLNQSLGGIKTMTRPPALMFIIDPKTESIAKKEAIRLKIPIVAVVDSNGDPEGIDYIIPANDDAIRSIQLVTKAIGDACLEGTHRRQVALAKDTSAKEGDEKPTSAFAKEREMKDSQGKAYVGKKKNENETVEEQDLERYASAKAVHDEKNGELK